MHWCFQTDAVGFKSGSGLPSTVGKERKTPSGISGGRPSGAREACCRLVCVSARARAGSDG